MITTRFSEQHLMCSLIFEHLIQNQHYKNVLLALKYAIMYTTTYITCNYVRERAPSSLKVADILPQMEIMGISRTCYPALSIYFLPGPIWIVDNEVAMEMEILNTKWLPSESYRCHVYNTLFTVLFPPSKRKKSKDKLTRARGWILSSTCVWSKRSERYLNVSASGWKEMGRRYSAFCHALFFLPRFFCPPPPTYSCSHRAAWLYSSGLPFCLFVYGGCTRWSGAAVTLSFDKWQP